MTTNPGEVISKRPTGPQRRILMTLAGGGFYWQSKALVDALEESFDLYFVTPDDPSIYWDRGFRKDRVCSVSRITTIADSSLWRRLTNFIVSFIDAYKVVSSVRPYAVVCVASSIAVPLCLWAKFFGKKSIFVESITRIGKASVTGRILTTLRLCDRFYVQWPEATNLYRGAVYRGTVL